MKKIAGLAALVLCGLCACFISCNEDADEEVWLFYATYNSGGTIGSSGLSQSEWESRLLSIQGESTIVLSSELTSDDLVTFAAALIASGKTGIKLDLSSLSIVSINAGTFSECTGITSVVLPATVVSIGENAFSGCTSLTLVTYGGTTDDWDDIAIASGNECLTEATVVCSDGSTEIVTVRYTGSASAFDSVVAVVKADEITAVMVTQSDETIYCTLESETASDEGDVASYVWYFQDAGIIYTLTLTVAGSSYTYDYSTEAISGTFTATLDGSGNKLGTVSVVLTDGEVTSVTVDGTTCKEQDDETYSYSDDEYTYTITISSSGGVFYYTYEITDGTFTASLSGGGEELGTVSVTVSSGSVSYITVEDTVCTETDGTFSYTTGDFSYAISVSGTNGVYSYTYDVTGGTFTASYSGTSSVFSTVVVTVSSGEITYITVDDTKCSSQDDDGKFTYSDSGYTYAISISSGNGVFTYTYDVTGGTFTASYSGTSSVFSVVTATVSSGNVTAVSVDGITCTAQSDGTFSYSADSITYAISVTGSGGVYTYTYEITGGTFEATYSGTSSDFESVTITVSSGAIKLVNVDGTKCSSQDDDGKFTYSDSGYTYAISISSGNGVFTYTYDVTGGTFTASYSGTSSAFSAVTVVVSSGAITSVTADGTACTAQDDGTYLCISGSTTYVITISGGNGSYSYSYETSEYFGSSGTTYEGFVTLLSSLSDGCTIVLSPYLTSTQLEYFAAALMNTSLSNVTVDMSCMTITQVNEKTFYECENITSVILPSCVEAIGSYAFYECANLTSVTIAEGTTSIGSYAFAYCSALTEVEIPDSVTSLGSYAFYYCTALETAVIGDGVATIPNYAFYYCRALTTVTIGSAVTTINSNAFYGCTALETVYYNGTKDGWSSISGYSSSYLKQATIVCTDGVYKY